MPIVHLKRGFMFNRIKTQIQYLPLLGIFIYLMIYFYGASIYPGGTIFDVTSIGFDHYYNYWCDLAGKLTRSGVPNPARPFAVGAMVFLPLTLIVFWWRIVDLLPNNQIKRRLAIRTFGVTAMLAAAFIFTPIHDLALDILVLFLSLSLITLITSLVFIKKYKMALAPCIPLGLGLVSFILWRSGIAMEHMPFMQKVTLVLFFIWITYVTCILKQDQVKV